MWDRALRGRALRGGMRTGDRGRPCRWLEMVSIYLVNAIASFLTDLHLLLHWDGLKCKVLAQAESLLGSRPDLQDSWRICRALLL